MKKLLLFILAIGVMSGVYAQNRNAVKNLNQVKAQGFNAVCDVNDLPLVPFKPRSMTSTKAMVSKAIGTSINVYSILVTEQNYLDVNAELNAIMFTHRTGGSMGPVTTSGNTIYSKISIDNFATYDSVLFTPSGTNRFRYPSGVIYNPAGNNNYTKAFAVTAGPVTPGSGWTSNFFGSKKLDNSTPEDVQYFAVSADTNILTRTSLSSDNGYFHITTPIYVTGGPGYLYHKIDNGVWNAGTSTIDWNVNYIKPLMKMRTFGDGAGGTVLDNWDANANMAFGPDGMHGYFYTLGADSLDGDPYYTSIPVVFETFDAGLTWVKQPIYMNFHNICSIRQQIWPTRLSLTTATTPDELVYRPDFASGAAGNEGSTPCVVDAFGYLHMAAIIEGRFSADPDSLGYSYANHPMLLFDIYKHDTSWDAIFIDTLRTGSVPSATSGYGAGTDAVGWDHKIHMSKSPDGTKIFVAWTDTDPTIDSTNIMPEPKAWGVDLVNNVMTRPSFFPTGSGNAFFFATPKTTLMNNGVFQLPYTSFDIYESNQNPANPVKHYYTTGMEFPVDSFIIPIPTYFPDVCSTSSIKTKSANDFVAQSYPNPSKGNTSIDVNIKETSSIRIVITNVLGQIVYDNSKNNAAAGTHNFAFNTKSWNNGVYFYSVTSENMKVTRKMIVQ